MEFGHTDGEFGDCDTLLASSFGLRVTSVVVDGRIHVIVLGGRRFDAHTFLLYAVQMLLCTRCR